jgi:hypothetical protein
MSFRRRVLTWNSTATYGISLGAAKSCAASLIRVASIDDLEHKARAEQRCLIPAITIPRYERHDEELAARITRRSAGMTSKRRAVPSSTDCDNIRAGRALDVNEQPRVLARVYIRFNVLYQILEQVGSAHLPADLLGLVVWRVVNLARSHDHGPQLLVEEADRINRLKSFTNILHLLVSDGRTYGTNSFTSCASF